LVLADSAYSSEDRRARLRARGVLDGIVYKRVRGQERLQDWQERWNAIVSRYRSRVEHPNAMMKQQLGYRRVRYRGRDRNALDFALVLTV
jgi:IS5 family transposase